MINLTRIRNINVRQPATEQEASQVALKLKKQFSEEYQRFLLQTNGFDADFLRLYPLDELCEMNKCYEAQDYCPDFFAIGDDGGGRAILIKDQSLQDNRIFLVDHGSMDPDDMEVIGQDLVTWLESGCPLP